MKLPKFQNRAIAVALAGTVLITATAVSSYYSFH